MIIKNETEITFYWTDVVVVTSIGTGIDIIVDGDGTVNIGVERHAIEEVAATAVAATTR